MSYAWETTEEDVINVLCRHKIVDRDIRSRAWNIVSDESDRVEEAVLMCSSDMEDQVEAAYSEIEDILIENGILVGKKKY